MPIPFQKVHGLGNDFIFLDLRDAPARMNVASARALCDRHLGVGADGVLCFTGTCAAPVMTIWNSDGTIPEMCGNGIRCFVLELVRRFGVRGNPITVQTGAGPLACRWEDRGPAGFEVEVDMGPGLSAGDDVVLDQLPELRASEVPARAIPGIRISTGNPHVVFFDRFTDAEIRAWGPRVTTAAAFDGGVNAEFAQVTAPGCVQLTVHERGAGFTLACGTGACATVAAGVRAGLLSSDTSVSVQLPGGRLKIVHRSADGHLLMTGPAVEVFEGCLPAGLAPAGSSKGC